MPQPAMENGHELRVSLHLPAGVVIPPFYLKEQDADTITRALQLGADAVDHLRQATEDTLHELAEQKVSDLTQRYQHLKAELSDARGSANREVARRLEEQRRSMEKNLEECNKCRNEVIAKLQTTCEELRRKKSTCLTDLKLQRSVMLQLDAEMQTVRNDERQKADVDVQREVSGSKSRVAEAVSRLEGLKSESNEQLKKDREELAKEQCTPSCDDAQPPPKRRKGVAGPKTSGARKLSLSELIQEVFGKFEGFRMRNIPNDLVTAQICRLQTLWGCRDNDGDVAGRMKRDLGASPTTDVAFLLTLQTGVAKHTEHVLEVEFVSQCQTLVHVNSLTDDDDPFKLLREYVCPLLKALHNVKQAYSTNDVDAANRLKMTLSRCTAAANTLRTELKKEEKGLELDKMQFKKRLEARKKWIDKGKAALEALLKDLVVPCEDSAVPASTTLSTDSV